MLFLVIMLFLILAMTLVILVRYENALIDISHYHGDDVEVLRDIAYTARKGKNWRSQP